MLGLKSDTELGKFKRLLIKQAGIDELARALLSCKRPLLSVEVHVSLYR